ncbi:MAG: hypothetical protein ACYT04_65225 [Nostoc sp.]
MIQSTFFTALSPNEEANLSGGNYTTKNLTLTGGNGATGGLPGVGGPGIQNTGSGSVSVTGGTVSGGRSGLGGKGGKGAAAVVFDKS